MLTLTTYDWVPESPRGMVRDLRIRWALEEAGLPYRMATTPFQPRGPEHFAHQPFGQVPWLTDGDINVFESGAMLLYVAERSGALLPSAAAQRSEAMQWLFAALNSMEMATVPWSMLRFWREPPDSAVRQRFDTWVDTRLGQLGRVLADREWLVGGFSIADIAMADVLRLVDRLGGLENHAACREYVVRATSRPAFRKVLADQLAQFSAADQARTT